MSDSTTSKERQDQRKQPFELVSQSMNIGSLYLTEFFDGEPHHTTKALLQFYAEVYQNLGGSSFLEFGGGPTIHSLITAARTVGSIHFTDYNTDCLSEVKKWIDGHLGHFDWSHFTRYALQYEQGSQSKATEVSVQIRHHLIRQRIRKVTRCNAFADDPLLGESEAPYGVVADNFCLSCTTENAESWLQLNKKLTDLVAPGGIFTTGALLNASYWEVQGVRFPAVRLTLALSALALPLGPSRMLAVLYSGIGYTMKILGPLSVLNFLQVTAHQGLLIKDGRVLEQIRTIDTVVFDKTGTLTLESPHVGQLYPCLGVDAIQLLTVAAAAEQRQSHPIARAICQAAQAQGIELPSISDGAYQIGYGIQVMLEGQQIRVGSRRFMEMEGIALPPSLSTIAEQGQTQGYSLVYVAIDNQLAGAIELHPTVRPETQRVVDALQEYGLELYIISGDAEIPTRSLATQLGIEHYFAETLPKDKAALIAQLQQEGRSVCFVGDGINDSVALKQAQVSISLRGASTIATDTAQIILMDETLNQLPHLFALSQEFEANMKVNLITSVVPGVIIIGGAFLGMVGYGGAILWFNLGLGAGLLNTLLPLLRRNNSEKT